MTPPTMNFLIGEMTIDLHSCAELAAGYYSTPHAFAELKQRGADVVFMDTGSFPQHISLDVTFAAGRWEGTFSYEGKKHELSAMRSVLVREDQSHYQVSRDAPEPIQAFLENEALKGFGGVLRSLTHVFWMNSLDASRSANFKPVQMRVAAEAGMLVPHSLITNTPDAVRRFYEECHGRMIYKTLHGGGIAGGGDVAHYSSARVS